MPARPIRNIAIIAHVDHGKTTLVDKLLRQSGTFAAHQHLDERVMDSNDLEKERGITILAKNTSVEYAGHPYQHRRHAGPRRLRRRGRARAGHGRWRAAAGRCRRRSDAADAFRDQEGAGPRPASRSSSSTRSTATAPTPTTSINLTFDLFDKLGATDEQLDFPIVYASGLNGWAALELDAPRDDMKPLFETVLYARAGAGRR